MPCKRSILLIVFTLLAAMPAALQAKLSRQDAADEKRRQEEKIKKNPDHLPPEELQKLRLATRKMLVEGEGKRSRKDVCGTVKEEKTACPACAAEFMAWIVETEEWDRGTDRDFCKHASARMAYDFDVWCCPKCGFAAFPTQFKRPLEKRDEAADKELAEEFRRVFILEHKMDPGKFGFTLDQKDLPTSIKYHMMGRCLSRQEYSAHDKARFCLQYAWVERQRLVAPVANAALSVKVSVFQSRLRVYKKKVGAEAETLDPASLLDFLDEVERDPALLDADGRLLLAIYRAAQLDRLGYMAVAAQLLEEAGKAELDKGVRATLDFKKSTLRHEFELLKQAQVHLHDALRDGDIPPERIPEYAYLVGETARRLGLLPEAALWLDLAESLTTPPAPLNAWAVEQKRLLGPGARARAVLETETLLSERLRAEHLRSVAGRKTAEAASERDPVVLALRSLRNSMERYRAEFEGTPSTVSELVELGLVKPGPGLEDAEKDYGLLVNRSPIPGDDLYLVVARNPRLDGEGRYWPAVSSSNTLMLLRSQPDFPEEKKDDKDAPRTAPGP